MGRCECGEKEKQTRSPLTHNAERHLEQHKKSGKLEYHLIRHHGGD